MKKIKLKYNSSNGLYYAKLNEIEQVLDILHIPDIQIGNLVPLREHIDNRKRALEYTVALAKVEVDALQKAWKERNEI